ncbi:molecular chaperone DjiA [Hyphococcus flavus]|uniref:Molecular chaperone DjiA n=1 Tax=Hyphococcus flavus TaxID=1866326 RepID=A0AAE9ZHM5_9PROT|nr:molecular chaperone DjiA [Hyphococcus flavus]WDI30375.1 molecular chaperone DjiA [Hyphococcus flavus]
MSFWDRIEATLAEAHKRTLGTLLDALATQRRRRDEAAFSIALIALSAKMAKADGIVTDDEIDAFRDYFHFPEKEAGKVRMIYQLAQQDVAGFSEYVKRVAKIFDDSPVVLEDVLDCLFHVAVADGVAHPRELELLEQAAKAFNISAPAYHRLKAAHLGLADDDPYLIIGVEPGESLDKVKAAYRALSRDHHPDALMARGVPSDLVTIAEGRMAAINTAYEQILTDYK